MIKVFCFSKNNSVYKVEIKGHSEFSSKGKDIVCAGVSSIVFGVVSFILSNFERKQHCIEIKDSSSKIELLGDMNHDLVFCMRMMVHQLENISSEYPNFVSIEYISPSSKIKK